MEGGLKQIRSAFSGKKGKNVEPVFGYLERTLKEAGGLRREDLLVGSLGKKDVNHILFLMHLGDPFVRQSETDELHSFWTLTPGIQKDVESLLVKLVRHFEKQASSATIEELASLNNPHSKNALLSYLEVSKNILEGPDGKWGPSSWPEINPKGIKDKAYVVLKNEEAPLHFTEVAKFIDRLQDAIALSSSRPALAQTVHNELIKDDRFVLVGRGTYGLQEWGYSPGTVKDVLRSILKSNGNSLGKDDIIKKTLEQRQVKESTIVMNLQNKQYFTRTSAGRYQLRT
ncbi:MAG TPA: hypothetical protein ENI13_01705 [candidate division CPR3 bacterium]|uniref:HTH HARE-type domain-containing protein n=1 Tax=candidate division CPR3 bacterium TaxID=2268181 RepID=A0A7C1SQ00_UNCC3|nr:hypothetical protein [candidate division CPR3 bacterium]